MPLEPPDFHLKFDPISLEPWEIAFVTLAAGEKFQTVTSLGKINKQAYCRMHRYDFIFEDKVLDFSRTIPWSKIPLILRVMENPKYKWVFWSDADALIMNFAHSLEELVDDRYNFIISKDFNALNTGHFFIRNCEWSRQFFRGVYARQDCLDHVWEEQQAVILELQEKPELNEFIKFIPQRLFNSYPIQIVPDNAKLQSLYQPGDFIIHFASIQKDRLPIFFDYCSQHVLNNIELPSLDQYLGIYGIFLGEDHPAQISVKLEAMRDIKTAAVIGGYSGNVIEKIVQNCPNLRKIVFFDEIATKYSNVVTEYLVRRYKEKFGYVKGLPLNTLPEYVNFYGTEGFDLIYIDKTYLLDHYAEVKGIIHSKSIIIHSE